MQPAGTCHTPAAHTPPAGKPPAALPAGPHSVVDCPAPPRARVPSQMHAPPTRAGLACRSRLLMPSMQPSRLSSRSMRSSSATVCTCGTKGLRVSARCRATQTGVCAHQCARGLGWRQSSGTSQVPGTVRGGLPAWDRGAGWHRRAATARHAPSCCSACCLLPSCPAAQLPCCPGPHLDQALQAHGACRLDEVVQVAAGMRTEGPSRPSRGHASLGFNQLEAADRTRHRACQERQPLLPPAHGVRQTVPHPPVGQHRRNQQDGVRAAGPRLEHLVCLQGAICFVCYTRGSASTGCGASMRHDATGCLLVLGQQNPSHTWRTGLRKADPTPCMELIARHRLRFKGSNPSRTFNTHQTLCAAAAPLTVCSTAHLQ